MQDNVTCRCTRSTGQLVYHTLAELVGLYVEVVENTSEDKETEENS